METELITYLQGLVTCNSINPTLAGGPGERDVADYIVAQCNTLGVDVELQEVGPDRFNVVAVVKGRKQAPPLLFNAHVDTVGVEDMADPFTLRQEEDRLYGRGSYDMKGSAAVMLALIETYAEKAPACDLLFTFVADEEDRSLGTEYLVQSWLPTLDAVPAAAFVLEPTEEKIGLAHKGFAWFEVEVTGRAAHGSRPDQGIDAILPLGAALHELETMTRELAEGRRDPLLGPGSLHAGMISGGSAWSVYPATARLQWERRTLPGETNEQMFAELNRVMKVMHRTAGGHRIKGGIPFVRQPHYVDADSLPVRLLADAFPEAEQTGVAYWADSALLGPHIPTVLYGPKGHGAHAVDEWVSLSSLVRVFKGLKRLIDG